MKAILKIKNVKTGMSRIFASVMNEHISGATVESVIKEFARQGGVLPRVEPNEELVVVELR